MNVYKIRDYAKKALYAGLGIRLPKILDQRQYWQNRGLTYMPDFFRPGYVDRELFYQDLLVDKLRALSFTSAFEAGCGFGWNILRLGREFPRAFVSGLDFSFNHLRHRGQPYLDGCGIQPVNADACAMPFADNAFDVGFTVGVFMNIHPARIEAALGEMARVCARRILHFEWNERHAPPELARKRAYKTNITSHDYDAIYARLGHTVARVTTCEALRADFEAHEARHQLQASQGLVHEGYGKYVLYEIIPGGAS